MRRHHLENEGASDGTPARGIRRWFRGRKMQAAFDRVYDRNRWHSDESRSGTGSTLEQTRTLIAELPGLFRTWDVHHVLDIPCGDFNWMRHVDLSGVDYIGADVVARLVEANQRSHAAPGVTFRVLDLVNDPLPRLDLIFCRDCMVHLSFRDGSRALRNMAASGTTYLLATTFTTRESNTDCKTGSWRILNLEKAPYGLPPPLHLLNEGCTEDAGNFADKSLGLWRLSDVAAVVGGEFAPSNQLPRRERPI